MVKICVVGCLHGELDKVYKDIASYEAMHNFKTHLVLCCGDFQAVRNRSDLQVMSVPQKFRVMGDFWRYYAEKVTAPIPTVFVGGNHEAANYLGELPYGGWVSPNIWYMGYAGVVQFGGLRIAGLSGIYKQHDYTRGHFEHAPYDEHTKRSAYHLRNVDTFRLQQLKRPVDIVLSHDWPRGVYHYGNSNWLVQRKPHFREEVSANSLGSPPGESVLVNLKPRYWFSAHLHVKFSALIEHELSSGQTSETRFLALDKCLPRREYLQFLDIEPENTLAPDVSMEQELALDPEWLTVLKNTNHLMSLTKAPVIMPSAFSHDEFDFSGKDEDITAIKEFFGDNLTIPKNFEATAAVHMGDAEREDRRTTDVPPGVHTNPQTDLICNMLEIVNPNAEFLGLDMTAAEGELESDIMADNSTASLSMSFARSENPEEVMLDDVIDSDDDSCFGANSCTADE